MADVWRCERCKKVKELSGVHLSNKTSVRSDCWPCAKKTTFHRESATQAPANASTSSAKTTTATTAMAAPPTATPTNAVHAVAFQNIFAAAKAAAEAAAKRTTSPSAFSFSSTSREGSKEGAATATTTAAAGAGTGSRPATASSVNASQSSGGRTPFSNARAPANPFLTPTVSAVSLRRFQTSYANAMTVKHDDPATAAAAGAIVPATVSANSKATSPSTSVTTPSTASPYVMEPAAGTSPPFTFRPNANYIPATSGAGWSTASVGGGMLPGSTASMAGTAAGGGGAAAAAATASAPGSGGRTMLPAVSAADSARAASASRSGVTASTAPAAAAAASCAPVQEGASVWMCEQCHKVKDLKGDHLRGKATVRSDCWPCAKKRTFVLTTASAMTAASRSLKLSGNSTNSRESGSLHSQRAGSAAQQEAGALFGKSSRVPSSYMPASSAFVNPFILPQSAPQTVQQTPLPTTATTGRLPNTNSGGVLPTVCLTWVAPAIPADAAAEEALLLHPQSHTVALPITLAVEGGGAAASASATGGANATTTAPTAAAAATTSAGAEGSTSGGTGALSSSWIVAAADSAEADLATHYAALARFDQQLLMTFRERLVTGVQLRAVWWERVLYVIAEDAPAETMAAGAPVAAGHTAQTSYDVVRAFAALGRYAALYLAIEQKLAGSRFRHVGRLFCPNEFALAAACCYANSFFFSERPSTAAPAAAGNTSSSSLSHSSVVPAASACRFRVYGPQTDPTTALSLWGRIISESPAAQMCVVSEEQRVVAAQTLYRRVSWLAAPQTMTGTAIQLAAEVNADEHSVDVVLLTGTMKLEELPQAVPLAQLSQPFV